MRPTPATALLERWSRLRPFALCGLAALSLVPVVGAPDIAEAAVAVVGEGVLCLVWLSGSS